LSGTDRTEDRTAGPVFQVNEAVAHREIEGQVVLLLPEDYELYTLNTSGKLVWNGLLEGHTASDLATQLAETYGISLERASADVAALLRDLETRGVVRRA
jgi:hypothetical protein